MKIGVTTYSFDNKDFREQLSSMLKNGINPHFIILHYGGIYRFFKGFNFFKKILKQRKLKFISFLLSYRKNKILTPVKYKLNKGDSIDVDEFISSAKIINVKRINDKSTIKTINSLGETLIVCNSGRLNSEVLDISNAVFLNVHASKLPLYRGMNNVEWALWENTEIYTTIHRISKGIDEGDILLQERIDAKNNNLTTISEFREYCFFKSNELVGKAFREYMDKKIFFVKQEVIETPLAQYYSMHPILKEYLQKKLSER